MCGVMLTTRLDTCGPGGWETGLASIATRGPDAQGQVIVDGMAFGHRRLSIIGLGPAGNQPMALDPNHILVFNGEIYNYRELADDLGLNARSDTEVLYEIGRRRQWASYVHRLRGMYAFVHFDREAGSLTTARDPFGIKPLYVRRHRDGEVSFASTVAALVQAFPNSALTPNSAALTGFLAMGLFPAGGSPFCEIEKLEPGSWMTWTRDPSGWKRRDAAVSGAGWPIKAVPDALADSVEAHLVADVEVAVLLSGGVDSTLLAALASRSMPGLRTFCLTNPESPDIDESAIARHNAALLGTNHSEVPVTPRALADEARKIIASTGEPFSDPAYLPLSVLCEAVSDHVKVALAGEGADELFGGYRRYDVERFLDSRTAGSALRRLGVALRFDRRFPSPVTQRGRVVHSAGLVQSADRHAALMFGAWPQVMAAFPEGDAQHESFLRRWHALPDDEWSLGQPSNRAYDTREWLPNVFLEKSDRASMLHSLELRTPYLDPVLAAAVRDYEPGDSRKTPLRQELARLLPEVRLPRAKKGLSVDTPRVVHNHFAGVVRRMLHDDESVLRRIGLHDSSGFADAVAASPALGFRVAMVGLWQEQWLRSSLQ